MVDEYEILSDKINHGLLPSKGYFYQLEFCFRKNRKLVKGCHENVSWNNDLIINMMPSFLLRLFPEKNADIDGIEEEIEFF